MVTDDGSDEAVCYFPLCLMTQVYDKAKLTKGISLMKTVQEMDNGAKGSKKARRESTTDPSTTATPSSSPFEPPTTVGGNPADCTDPSPQLRGTDMTTDLPTGVTKAKDKYVARIKIKGIQCRGIPRDDPNTAGRDYEVIKKQKDNLANDIADMNSCDEKRNVIEDKWKLLMEST